MVSTLGGMSYGKKEKKMAPIPIHERVEQIHLGPYRHTWRFTSFWYKRKHYRVWRVRS